MVALLGHPKFAWAMFGAQLVGVATAKRFVEPYLPSEWVRGETWSLPASMAVGLLAVFTLKSSSTEEVCMLGVRVVEC